MHSLACFPPSQQPTLGSPHPGLKPAWETRSPVLLPWNLHSMASGGQWMATSSKAGGGLACHPMLQPFGDQPRGRGCDRPPWGAVGRSSPRTGGGLSWEAGAGSGRCLAAGPGLASPSCGACLCPNLGSAPWTRRLPQLPPSAWAKQGV